MRRNPGFTLIELIVFIVIVSVGLAGILLPIMNNVRNSADPMIARQMVLIADSLMDEIMAKDTLVGTDTSGIRSQFDGVMNYNGYSTTGIQTIDGSPIDGLAGYSLSVTVSDAALSLSNVPAGKAKLIKIAVTHGSDSFILEGYRFAYE